MSNIKVSVIILVYNTSQYLDKCLSSVLSQTLNEIEIICIDDKSIDNSVEIINKYKKNDSRIILVENTHNMGIGYNRDLGVKIARGEYIGFLDSDDYIDIDYYFNLYHTAIKYSSDITKTENIETYDKNYNRKSNLQNKLDYKNEGILNLSCEELIDSLNYYKDTKYSMATSVWSKIFRREYILQNNIVHSNIRNGEDLVFLINCMTHILKYLLIIVQYIIVINVMTIVFI